MQQPSRLSPLSFLRRGDGLGLRVPPDGEVNVGVQEEGEVDLLHLSVAGSKLFDNNIRMISGPDIFKRP